MDGGKLAPVPTCHQLPPPFQPLPAAAPASGTALLSLGRPTPSPNPGLTSAASTGRNGLLSQQMASDGSGGSDRPPSRPPSVSGFPSAPMAIPNGHAGSGGSQAGHHRAGSACEPSGPRSGAVTPEDAPSTRNGSKPTSPKSLEAQVAKLVQGQQLLSNQLEELALQISLAQSGLAVVPAAVQQRAAASQAAAAAQPAPLLRRWAAAGTHPEVRAVAWAAVGALTGAATTILLLQGRR